MKKLQTPIRTIREKCLDCCCHQYKEVKLCEADDCPCWPYRHGRRPTEGDAEKHLQAKANLDERNRQMQQRIKRRRDDGKP